MLRLLHTSDWHLGHTLADIAREEEHDAFLRWLLDTLEGESIDALIVAGDIFETANPPASALRAFYDFLARARRRFRDLPIIIIGGNHDSAARLDAPEPLLRALDVRIIGALPRRADASIDAERAIVPLRDRSGRVAAHVVAIPFLRECDLPLLPAGDDATDVASDGRLVESVRRVYAEAIEAARARRAADQSIVVTGHLYMVGGEVSELSERRIQNGNQHAVPADVFPSDVAYVALGHLHRAQAVGGRENVRYSGSPIPLSLAESSYPHQVVVVELEADRPARVKPLRVPRSVGILRIPTDGALPLDELLATLETLPVRDVSVPEWKRPFLEVAVRLAKPEPGLRRAIEEKLERKSPRLVKVTVERTGSGATLADVATSVTLRDLGPEDVFVRRWQKDHAGEPPRELRAAFQELLDVVAREEPSLPPATLREVKP